MQPIGRLLESVGRLEADNLSLLDLQHHDFCGILYRDVPTSHTHLLQLSNFLDSLVLAMDGRSLAQLSPSLAALGLGQTDDQPPRFPDGCDDS
ncbi:hypothetical protein Vi05172_g11595 [Venturia inaequalis]|nr:hypothetical protein Vi05172_g11595 [Venturia inaequalis]